MPDEVIRSTEPIMRTVAPGNGKRASLSTIVPEIDWPQEGNAHKIRTIKLKM